MGTSTAKTGVMGPAPSFIAFVFSLAGWALLALWFLRMGAGFLAHGTAASVGLWLSFLSIRRPGIGPGDRSQRERSATQEHRTFRGADAGWALLLLAVGAVLGVLVLRGGTIALGAAGIGLSFAPWSRVHFCRNHFGAACTMVWIGMASIMAPGYRSITPMFLPIACWVLWACACLGLFWRIDQLSRAQRIAKATPQVPDPISAANTAATSAVAQVGPDENTPSASSMPS
jgi:hypothetical protein